MTRDSGVLIGVLGVSSQLISVLLILVFPVFFSSLGYILILVVEIFSEHKYRYCTLIAKANVYLVSATMCSFPAAEHLRPHIVSRPYR